MSDQSDNTSRAAALSAPLELACGIVLKNRLAKASMSDSLGDGAGNPTEAQVALYQRWSMGGAALSLIGEVQVGHRYPEKPGNLVLGPGSDMDLLARLAGVGSADDAHVWPQLGHAGALAHPPISSPAGPSALDVDGLQCRALELSEVEALPAAYAQAAARAQAAGFRGAQIHAGHGFLLSQFLSPLFNHRSDHFGGSIEARCQLLLDIVRSVRTSVGPQFAIAVKINSSDQLAGGLTEDDALTAISMLGDATVDLIDISGGTYFPGAPSSSDRRTSGPYFVEFARRARAITDVPLMVTGGFKTRQEAADAVLCGAADVVGLARPLVLDPDLSAKWCQPDGGDPEFPTFDAPPSGGITAWYTMRLAAIAEGADDDFDMTLDAAIETYEARDATRTEVWNDAFVDNEEAVPPEAGASNEAGVDGDWHRNEAISANNSTWDYLDGREHTPDDADELLQRAYAAAYHWKRATGSTTVNLARASWLVSRAHVVLGHGEVALHHADRAVDFVAQAGQLAADFDHAYGHEGRARALACLGRLDEAQPAYEQACATRIDDEQDREVFESDLAAEPWFGLMNR